MPSLGLIKLCYSGKYTYEEMRKKIRGRGGMYAHLGTSDCRVIEQMIRDGDRHADLIFQAQAYQIAKAIGLLSIVLKGDCDAIILTGGVANSKMLTERVEDYVKFIAPVCVMPGENEMEALALGGMRILQGEENARIYHILNGVNGKEGRDDLGEPCPFGRKEVRHPRAVRVREQPCGDRWPREHIRFLDRQPERYPPGAFVRAIYAEAAGDPVALHGYTWHRVPQTCEAHWRTPHKRSARTTPAQPVPDCRRRQPHSLVRSRRLSARVTRLLCLRRISRNIKCSSKAVPVPSASLCRRLSRIFRLTSVLSNSA